MDYRDQLEKASHELNQCRAGTEILLDYFENFTEYADAWEKGLDKDASIRLTIEVTRCLERLMIVTYAINNKLVEIEEDIDSLTKSLGSLNEKSTPERPF